MMIFPKTFALLVGAERVPLQICSGPAVCHGLLPAFGRRYLQGLSARAMIDAFEAVWGERWGRNNFIHLRSKILYHPR